MQGRKEVTMNDKIKHLLATAYKTDSIEKNKWRIENREQRREQRKKELKELMEKEKTMSNTAHLCTFNLHFSNMIISQFTCSYNRIFINVKYIHNSYLSLIYKKR